MNYLKGLLLLLVLCLCAPGGYANISIFPYAVDFDANTNKRVVSVRVSNPTKERKTYRISVIDMRQLPSGGFEALPADQKPADSAAPFIIFSPRQFTLDGGDFQTVNISRKPLLKVPDGDYTSHLKIQEVDTPMPAGKLEQKGVSVEVKFKYNLTIPIYIKKGKTAGIIAIASAEPFEREGKPYLRVKLKRQEGLRYFRGVVTATQDKKVIGEVRNIRVYPTTEERYVDFPLNKPLAELAGKKIKIVYKDESEKGNLAEAEFTLPAIEKGK